MKCTECKFCIMHDTGYSNYTVEGTDVDCIINLNPAFRLTNGIIQQKIQILQTYVLGSKKAKVYTLMLTTKKEHCLNIQMMQS